MIDNELISLLLARAQIFHNFTIEDISILLETATEEKYKAGEIIFKEGSKGRDLFIIKSGQVQITNKTEQGVEQIVTTLHDGQVFGEMSLIDKGPRSATVKALISTIIYSLCFRYFSCYHLYLYFGVKSPTICCSCIDTICLFYM